MIARTAVLFLVGSAAVLAGCQQSRPALVEPRTRQEASFQAVWDASEQVLKDHDFEIDRRDRWEGVITTYWAVSRNWFEFWRRDSASTQDVLENSLQTIERSAVVRVRPTGQGTLAYEPDVRVAVQRWNRPSMRVTNVADAYDQYTYGGSPRYLTDYGKQWSAAAVGLPDDEDLARQIEREIRQRAEAAYQRILQRNPQL